MAFLLPSGISFAGTVGNSNLPTLTLEEITDHMVQTDLRKRLDVQEFTVTRKYVLRNSHMDHDAVMVVRVSFRQGQGKTLQVVESSGAEGMSGKVLERLVKAEEDASRSESPHDNSVTPDHYNFELAGTDNVDGHPCYVLELHPKVKSKYLMRGKAWIDAGDFAVVKMEGRPAASLSFWIGKPYIVQKYKKQGDYWMASYNRSVSASHILGESELTIEYGKYNLHCQESSRVAERLSPHPSIE